MAIRLRGRMPPLLREALAEFMSTFILLLLFSFPPLVAYRWFTIYQKFPEIQPGTRFSKDPVNLPGPESYFMIGIFATGIATLGSMSTFGIGSVAQMVLSNHKFGTFFSVNFGWGIGVTLGCYWAGGVSGAHMNPAVSLAFAIVKRLPWYKVSVYWTAQMLGAFVASACVYGVYYDALNAFDGGVRQILGPNGTAGIWATYPQSYLSIANGFADQLFGTALLVGCVFAIVDSNNNAPDKGVVPVMIGLVVFVIGATFGFNCGYAINPARDLAPRIFTAIAGWGAEVFTVAEHWAWVPVVASMLGGVLGAVVYIVFIELHHELSEEDSNSFTDHPYLPVHETENGQGVKEADERESTI